MGNPVMWFDLGAADPEPLKAFYSDLFGWKLQPAGEAYTLILTGGGINGGISRSVSGHPWVAFYVDVPDPAATLDRAVEMGGTVVVPASEFGGTTFAMFADPDGMLIGLTRTTDPIPAGPESGSGVPVDWFEVIAPDLARSQAFFAELFGWTYDPAGPSYGMVQTGEERGIPGGVGTSDRSIWVTVYASVDDVERYLARAGELGAAREYGPVDVDDHMQSGAFRDPVGNLFGVYHHAPH